MHARSICRRPPFLPFSSILLFPHIYARIQSNRRRASGRASERARLVCACHVHDIFLFPSVPTTLRSSDKKYRMDGRRRREGRVVGRREGRELGVRGAVVVRSGGNGEREAPQLLDSCYESRTTYPRTTAELFLSSEFDNSRLNRPILKP